MKKYWHYWAVPLLYLIFIRITPPGPPPQWELQKSFTVMPFIGPLEYTHLIFPIMIFGFELLRSYLLWRGVDEESLPHVLKDHPKYPRLMREGTRVLGIWILVHLGIWALKKDQFAGTREGQEISIYKEGISLPFKAMFDGRFRLILMNRAAHFIPWSELKGIKKGKYTYGKGSSVWVYFVNHSGTTFMLRIDAFPPDYSTVHFEAEVSRGMGEW